jgi:hypothetical protein
MIYCGYGVAPSESDFGKVSIPVPDPNPEPDREIRDFN